MHLGAWAPAGQKVLELVACIEEVGLAEETATVCGLLAQEASWLYTALVSLSGRVQMDYP